MAASGLDRLDPAALVDAEPDRTRCARWRHRDLRPQRRAIPRARGICRVLGDEIRKRLRELPADTLAAVATRYPVLPRRVVPDGDEPVAAHFEPRLVHVRRPAGSGRGFVALCI